ncbi:hypothetical protein JCM2811A_08710 [Methylorubrum rhodinum]
MVRPPRGGLIDGDREFGFYDFTQGPGAPSGGRDVPSGTVSQGECDRVGDPIDNPHSAARPGSAPQTRIILLRRAGDGRFTFDVGAAPADAPPTVARPERFRCEAGRDGP